MKILSKNQIETVLEEDEYRETRIEYINRKIKEGYKIYYPEANELLIDIDSAIALKTLK